MTSMNTETSIQDLASEAYDCFESFKRDGDETTIYKLRDGSPDWIKELVREAHGDFFPDDYRYEAIMNALAWIHDNDGDEDPGEFADSNVDVYTADRYRWLSSNLRRSGYCDEAASEGIVSPEADIVDRIGVGQYMELTEVYGLVYRALEERLSEIQS